jgi:hypothetical protein
MMRSLLLSAAAGVFLVAAVFWNAVMVAGLRFFRINLPFSLPFRFFRRKEADLLKALNGRSINAYVFISGLLLFACRLSASLTVYDYVGRHFIEHSAYGEKDLALSMAWFVLLVICGFWISIRQWQRSTESGIGFAILTILILKVSTDTIGVLMVCVFLIPATLFCLFVYFGIRNIKGVGGGSRYSSRSDYGAKSNFIAEQFIPSEAYKTQQAMALKLTATGVNSDERPEGNHLPTRNDS